MASTTTAASAPNIGNGFDAGIGNGDGNDSPATATFIDGDNDFVGDYRQRLRIGNDDDSDFLEKLLAGHTAPFSLG